MSVTAPTEGLTFHEMVNALELDVLQNVVLVHYLDHKTLSFSRDYRGRFSRTVCHRDSGTHKYLLSGA